jgi:hypothetical protein
VASNTNDGIGTNGISEPKKLTSVRAIYPTSDAKGKRISEKAEKSTSQSFY